MRNLQRFDNQGFVRGRPAWVEGLWMVVRALFFSHGWPVPSRLKVALLRAFGATVGEGVVIRSRVNVTFPWRFSCGDFVWIGDEVLILSLAEVRLGSQVCVSQRAFLCTGSHDHRKAGFDLVTKPVVVGDGCWVGAQVFVGPGVTLGSNTVCAAGSVVVRDAGPDVMVGGNPARVIRALEDPV